MTDYIEREAAIKQCERHSDYTAWSIKDGIEAIPAADAVEVSEDFEAILNCAVRYAMGRQSYMPSLVVGYITPLIPRLSDKTLLCFDKDIAEQKHLGYGDPIIDEPQWMEFYDAVRAERTKRCEERKDGDDAIGDPSLRSG